MTFESLLRELPEQYSVADRDFINRAFRVALDAHEGQFRASGEEYITHCVEVATILAQMKVPPIVIAAGLLHDTVEDTDLTLDHIEREFGEKVRKLVDGVTKLTELPRVSRGDQHSTEAEKEEQERSIAEIRGLPDPDEMIDQLAKSRKFDSVNESLRKTILAMAEDPLVPLIKLADRVHNMRTLKHMPEHKQKRIAQQTLDIFAPLANRLGIWQMKWELEDLSFRYVNPKWYKKIADDLNEKRSERESELEEIIKLLQGVLTSAGITAEISGRPKHIYSIYRKMMRKGVGFDQVHDVRGVRIIVKDIPTCYAALGVIHTQPDWTPMSREFDDYIAVPKDNFYKSLHTAVIMPNSKQLEVQIRTNEMHQNSEYGIAAHWRYKEGAKHDEEFERRVIWFRRLLAGQNDDADDAEEFVEGIKADIFQDRVYVLTPAGDIIDLPAGSTPIDFAYHIHTEVGHRCRGGKINGKLVSLDYTLQTGDQVEILTSKRGGPSRDWLSDSLGLVKTHRAKTKVRRWFRIQARDQKISQGRQLLERELRRVGKGGTKIEKIAQEFDLKSVDDLYAAIGSADLPVSRIIDHFTLTEVVEEEFPITTRTVGEVVKTDSEISILGTKGLLTNLAKCCNPAPGDEILGYITRGRGATIHRADCPNVLRIKDSERLVTVSWGSQISTYSVAVQVKAFDREGLIRDVSAVIADEGIGISEGTIKSDKYMAILDLAIDVKDVSQLSRVLNRIEQLSNVIDARRVNPG